MVSRNRKLASLVRDSAGNVSADRLSDMIDNTIDPETLNFAVDTRGAGQNAHWLWSWNPTTLPYARAPISLSMENEIPLYKRGTYQLDNFAAYNTNGNSTQTHSIKMKWVEEAGDANLVDWVTYDSSQTVTFEGVAATPQKVQRLTWQVPATITPPTLNSSTQTYNISAAPGVYNFSGIASGDNPTLGPLYRGNTYNFTLDSTTNGHPFYLTTDSNGEYSATTYGGEYTDGVTNSRAQGSSGTDATLSFVVPANAPDTLNYQCGNHKAMYGTLTIKDLKVDSSGEGETYIYFQHAQEQHKTRIRIKESPTIVGQMCLAWNPTKNKYEPQDLGHYMDKTPSFVTRVREEIGDNAIDSALAVSLIDSSYINARVSGVDSGSVSAIVDSNYVNARVSGVDSGSVSAIVDSNYVSSRLSSTNVSSIVDSDYVSTRANISAVVDSDYVTARVGSTEQHTTLTQNLTLYVLNGSARWYAPRALTIQSMTAYVQTAPGGANLNLRVNKNGSSIATPTISAGATSGSLTGLTTTMNAGDYLTVDITQVGTTGSEGSNLSLVIVYK